jgi:hypothetical protein
MQHHTQETTQRREAAEPQRKYYNRIGFFASLRLRVFALKFDLYKLIKDNLFQTMKNKKT